MLSIIIIRQFWLVLYLVKYTIIELILFHFSCWLFWLFVLDFLCRHLLLLENYATSDMRCSKVTQIAKSKFSYLLLIAWCFG